MSSIFAKLAALASLLKGLSFLGRFGGLLGPVGALVGSAASLAVGLITATLSALAGALSDPVRLTLIALGFGLGFWQGVEWNKSAFEKVSKEYADYRGEVRHANEDADKRVAEALAQREAAEAQARKDSEARVAAEKAAEVDGEGKSDTALPLPARSSTKPPPRRVRVVRKGEAETRSGSWMSDLLDYPR